MHRVYVFAQIAARIEGIWPLLLDGEELHADGSL